MEKFEEHPGKYSTKATGTVTENERILSKLGHGLKKAKAQQILRLLKDQECLNQRFKDCALDDDDDNNDDCDSDHAENGDPQDVTNIEQEARNADYERSSKHNSGVKKLTATADPGRCRTSMGFYNEAECEGALNPELDDSKGLDDSREDDLDVSFDTRDILMNHLASGPRAEKSQRHMLRLHLQGDTDNVIVEDSVVAQSARSSRPKTGVVSGSVRGKQYRRQSQKSSNGGTGANSVTSTTLTRFEPPFTPRGGVRGFCDGQTIPREEAIPCITPRKSEFKLCLSPRKNEVDFCYTPRGNPVTNTGHTAQRQNHAHNDVSGFYTPRYDVTGASHQYNELSGYFTPRHVQGDTSGNSRREEITNSSMTLRGHQLHKAVRDGYSNPRVEPSTPCCTPRGENTTGGHNSRIHKVTLGGFSSINNHSQSSFNSKKNFFEMGASASTNEVTRPKRTNLVTKSFALSEQVQLTSPRINPHTPRNVLSVDQSPVHVVPSGTFEGEITTPRRQKSEVKVKTPRGGGDLQRMGVHQNLSKFSERVHPISVMKLPPLDTALNKPVISQGI